MKEKTKKQKNNEEELASAKSPAERGKMTINFDEETSAIKKSFKKLPKEEPKIPSKIILKKKILVEQENQSKASSLSVDSPADTQKKGNRKTIGGLARIFHTKKIIEKTPLNVQQPSLVFNEPKPEEIEEEQDDEIASIEAEIEKKKELIKQKQEERQKKIEEEKKRLELERQRIEQENIEKQKLKEFEEEKKLVSAKKNIKIIEENIEITSEQDSEHFKNLDEVIMLPDDLSVKLCPKCSSKMKRKWVKNYGDILVQEFRCKNKMCKNLVKLEINKI